MSYRNVMLNTKKNAIIKTASISILLFFFFLILNPELANDYWSYQFIYNNFFLLQNFETSPNGIKYLFYVLAKLNLNYEDARVILLTLNSFVFLLTLLELIKKNFISKDFFLKKKNLLLFTYFAAFIIFEFFILRLRTGIGLSLFLISIYFLKQKSFFAIVSIILLIITSIEIFFFFGWLIVFIYFYKIKKKETIVINFIISLYFFFFLGHFNYFRYLGGEITGDEINPYRLFVLGLLPYLIYLLQTRILGWQYSNLAKNIFNYYYTIIFVTSILEIFGFNNYSGEKISRFLSLFQIIFFFLFIRDYKLKYNIIYIYFFVIYTGLSIRS